MNPILHIREDATPSGAPFRERRALDRLLPIAVAELRRRGVNVRTNDAWELALRRLPTLSEASLSGMAAFALVLVGDPEGVDQFVDEVLVRMISRWARRVDRRPGAACRDAEVLRVWVHSALVGLHAPDDVAGPWGRVVRTLTRHLPDSLLERASTVLCDGGYEVERLQDPQAWLHRAAVKARDWVGGHEHTTYVPAAPLFRLHREAWNGLAALLSPAVVASLVLELAVAAESKSQEGALPFVASRMRQATDELEMIATEPTRLVARYDREVRSYLRHAAGARAGSAYRHYLLAVRSRWLDVLNAEDPPLPAIVSGRPFGQMVKDLAARAVAATRRVAPDQSWRPGLDLRAMRKVVMLKRILVFAKCLGDYGKEPVASEEDLHWLAMDGRRFVASTQVLRDEWGKDWIAAEFAPAVVLFDRLRVRVVEPLEEVADSALLDEPFREARAIATEAAARLAQT